MHWKYLIPIGLLSLLVLLPPVSGEFRYEEINENSFRVILTGSDYQNARNNPAYYADQISSYIVDRNFRWVTTQEYLDLLISLVPDIATAPIYPMVVANRYSSDIVRQGLAWKAGTVLQEANNWYSRVATSGLYDGFYIDVIKACKSPTCPAEWRWSPVPSSQSPQNNQAQFKITSGTYSETFNLDQAIKNEFGSDYRLADWTDVLAQSTDIHNWATNVPINPGNYFVSRNGQRFYDGSRHYFITRHTVDHTPHAGYLVHDQIDNNFISLGSWYGVSMPILCVKSTSTQTRILTNRPDFLV